ncbi:ABC transporter ATP-binding protein [Paenibacillus sp. WLX2291]|uniref:ABC transporter ATP-binding protein n=1 Tax=Paenibacillus sp. WLX2291 TaxID=3296934 RepID=UPI00398452AD
MTLLQVRQLCKSYRHQRPLIVDNDEEQSQSSHMAVNQVSFDLNQGECLGLVGESGCGKSTLARCLMRIERIDSGQIIWNGQSLESLSERQLYPWRRRMQIVFQNPSAALNPKLNIRDSLLDPYKQYRDVLSLQHFTARSGKQLVNELLDAVELPTELADRYPHELSGGQRQRVTIARAISIEPELIILDEPTASLDVISQGAVLKLLTELREQLNLSYLFISHDLAAVSRMSQRLMVMKDGRVVDTFDQQQLFAEDRHEYTRELISIF